MKIGLAYDIKQEALLGNTGDDDNNDDDAAEEYDSPDTIKAIASALGSAGHTVIYLGGGQRFLTNIISLQDHVQLVFNISEGVGSYRSREAQVPSVLEMLDIPYSGSDPQCLAICLDKPLAKKLVQGTGVCTPRWLTVSNEQEAQNYIDMPFLPAFVKPAFEGSSKGIHTGCRVQTQEQMTSMVRKLLAHYHQPVVVEEFIAGDEVTVGIVGNHLLGIMRIVPKNRDANFVYSLEAKRDWQHAVDYECPAQYEDKIIQHITYFSLQAFTALGCRDCARLDFRINAKGIPYFLECNPLPGLNPQAGDLPIMASLMGWSYQQLITSVLDSALERYPALCT